MAACCMHPESEWIVCSPGRHYRRSTTITTPSSSSSSSADASFGCGSFMHPSLLTLWMMLRHLFVNKAIDEGANPVDRPWI